MVLFPIMRQRQCREMLSHDAAITSSGNSHRDVSMLTPVALRSEMTEIRHDRQSFDIFVPQHRGSSTDGNSVFSKMAFPVLHRCAAETSRIKAPASFT